MALPKDGRCLGVAALFLLAGPMARAQNLSIEHPKIGCIVAGKYPKLGACFAPPSLLAQGRVYFRKENTPHWYSVSMRSEAPCMAGILPRLQKTMVGQRVEIHFAGIAKDFEETRSQDFAPMVVASEQDCKEGPVAPFLSKASVVVSGAAGAPATAVGFVGGVGILTAPVVVTALVVGTGTTVLVATNGGGSTAGTTPTSTSAGGSTTTVAGTLPPPPTTAPPPQQVLSCKPEFSITPDPPEGPEPLTVTFDMCATTGGQRRFSYDFDGNGTVDLAGPCSATRTYTRSTISPLGPTTITPAVVSYFPTVTAGCKDPGVGQSQTYEVRVGPATLTVKALDDRAPGRRLSWVSQLDVPEARGQVVVNGTAAVYAAGGRSAAVALGRRGENRIEAQLVQAGGQPGTWRFELGSMGSFERGSLHVIAGEVATVTADSIVFRFEGKPGERVVFAFRTSQ